MDWYFTAPWQPVPVRRGDALGFRAGADYFADLVAPGLNNATTDARWISILSWCLKWSHVAWQNAGGTDLSGRDEQRTRYAWLRPLELIWVARTLKAEQETGQLRGRRSIDRWFKANQRPPNFAMSDEQFRRYRQIGMYGAYRVIFRTTPALTSSNNGWTPASTALQLADIVNSSMRPVARLFPKDFDAGVKWGNWTGAETRFWLERGWPAWALDKNFLPSTDGVQGRRLLDKERALLMPALFAKDSIRLATAQTLADAREAKSHSDLCNALAKSKYLLKRIDPAALAPLPAFSHLADIAMDAMRAIWYEMHQQGPGQASTFESLTGSSDLRSKLTLVSNASIAWLREPTRKSFPEEYVVNKLAATMKSASSSSTRIEALSRHHEEHGGGRRWFHIQANRLVPLVAHSEIPSSNYRFRLRSLAMLAAQCGVPKIGKALNILTRESDDSQEGDFG